MRHHCDTELAEFKEEVNGRLGEIMSTLDDLAAVDAKLAADVQGLVTAIAAIPAGTLSAGDQKKLDDAVASVTGTDKAVTDETAKETPPPPPA